MLIMRTKQSFTGVGPEDCSLLSFSAALDYLSIVSYSLSLSLIYVELFFIKGSIFIKIKIYL